MATYSFVYRKRSRRSKGTGRDYSAFDKILIANKNAAGTRPIFLKMKRNDAVKNRSAVPADFWPFASFHAHARNHFHLLLLNIQHISQFILQNTLINVYFFKKNTKMIKAISGIIQLLKESFL